MRLPPRCRTDPCRTRKWKASSVTGDSPAGRPSRQHREEKQRRSRFLLFDVLLLVDRLFRFHHFLMMFVYRWLMSYVHYTSEPCHHRYLEPITSKWLGHHHSQHESLPRNCCSSTNNCWVFFRLHSTTNHLRRLSRQILEINEVTICALLPI